MEDTTALRAALVEALHKVDNPPQVEQPETVIKHALLACMEAYGPTMEMLERQAAQVEKMREALIWYAEQVAECRKLTYEGDVARGKLDRDGGDLARAALESSDE